MPRDEVRDDALSSQRTGQDANTEGYRPLTPASWPGGVDPGTVKDALDAIAAAGGTNPVGMITGLYRAPAVPDPDRTSPAEVDAMHRPPADTKDFEHAQATLACWALS